MTWAPAVTVPLALAAGVGVGLLYFAALYHGVRLQMGQRNWPLAILLHLLRPLLAIAAFWGLAQAGALALLSGLGGFLIARLLVRRRVSGTVPWT